MVPNNFDPVEKIWRGPQHLPLHHNHASAGLIAFHSLTYHPDKVIQISYDDGSQMTCKEIRVNFIRIALNLQTKCSIEKEDVIGIVGKNTNHLTSLVLGVLSIGAIINPQDPLAKVEDMTHMFNLTKPKVIVCDPECVDKVKQVLINIKSDTKIFLTDSSISLLLESHPDEETFIPADIGDVEKVIGAITSTSGSTGPSKAVALSQATLIYFANYYDFPLSSDHVRLCFSNLNWFSGIVFSLLSVMRNCTRIITKELFSAPILVDIVEKYKVTYILSQPNFLSTVWNYLDEHSKHLLSITQWDLCGFKVTDTIMKKMKTYLPNTKICNTYGQTECFGTLFRNMDMDKKNCEGKMQAFMEAKIEEDSGNLLGVNEPGELVYRLGFPLLGYYKNDEQNAKNFKSGGWLRSGDFGYFDEDGDLHLMDRKMDIITTQEGDFVAPSDVENVISEIQGVFMVCVAGIPDSNGLDQPTAFIIKQQSIDLTEEDVIKFVEQSLPKSKWLTGGVRFVSEFPTTVSGKRSRRILKEMVLNNEL